MTWTPRDIPNVTFYLPTSDLGRMYTDSGATTRPTASGDAIYLVDEPGATTRGTATADNTRPVLTTASGRSGLRFFNDGTNKRLTFPDTSAPLNHFSLYGRGTIAGYVKFDNATSSTFEILADTANTGSSGHGFSLHRLANEELTFIVCRGTTPVTLTMTMGTITDTDWHSFIVRVGPGADGCTGKLDDNAPVTATIGTLSTNATTSQNLRLGLRSSSADLTPSANLSELVITSDQMSEADEALWRAYNPALGDFSPVNAAATASEYQNVTRNGNFLTNRGAHDPFFADDLVPAACRTPSMTLYGDNRIWLGYAGMSDLSDAAGFAKYFRVSGNGNTWSPPKRFYRLADFVPNRKWSNGCTPIWDHVNERMHVLFTTSLDDTDPYQAQPTEDRKLWWTYSDTPDDPASYSTPVDVTATVNPDGYDYLISGPGAGLTLRGGSYAGTPCCMIYRREKDPTDGGATTQETKAFVSLIYFDGDDWVLGAAADITEAANEGGSEACMTELRDANGDYTGVIYANARIVLSGDTDERLHWKITAIDDEFLPTATRMQTTGAADVKSDATHGSCLCDSQGNLLVFLAASDTYRRNGLNCWRSTNHQAGTPTFERLRMPIDARVSYNASVPINDGQEYLIAYETAINLEEEAADTGTPGEYIRMKRITLAEMETPLTTTPSTQRFYFNEATSGTLSAMGCPIYNHGTVGNPIQTKGTTGWTWTADGVASDGTGNGLILQSDLGDNTDTIGGPLDWRADSFTLGMRIEIAEGLSDGRYGIIDNRADTSTVRGHTLAMVVADSGTTFSIVQSWTQQNSGTNVTHTLSNPPIGSPFNLYVIRDKVAGNLRLRADDDDGEFSGSTATTDTQGNVVGFDELKFGSFSDDSGKLAIEVTDLSFERGIARTDGELTQLNAGTAPTVNQLLKYTPPTVELPASYDDCVLALGAKWRGHYDAGLDFYGGWDKGILPAKGGIGCGAIRCAKTGKLFRQNTSGRNAFFFDTALGPMIRPQYDVVSPFAAPHFHASDVDGTRIADTDLDFIQNSGNFAISALLCVTSRTTGYLLSNRTNAGTVPHIEVYWSATASNIGVSLRDATGVIVSETGFPSVILPNRIYYIGISGSSGTWAGGAANKLQFYWGEYIDGEVPTLQTATGSGTMSLGTDGAAGSLYVMSRNNSTPNSPLPGYWANLLIFDTPLTTAEHQEWAEVALLSGRGISSGRSGGIGIGMGIGI